MRKSILFLLLILIAVPLYSEALRVGLYGVPSYLEEDVKASLSAYTDAGIRSDYLESAVKERLEKDAEKQAKEKDHSLLISEKEREERKDLEFSGPDKTEFVTVTPDERIRTLFEDLDERALEYVRNHEDLDLMIIFRSESEGQIVFLDSFISDPQVRPFISTAHIKNSPPELYDEFTLRFHELYFDGAGFIRREGGHLKPVLPGEYESDGIAYTVEAGEEVSLFSETMEGTERTYTLFSIPYDASLSVFALDGVSLPLSVKSDEDNVILSLSKPGFLSDTYQLSSSTPPVSALSLRPEWMGREGRLKEAKDDFYRALRDTFLSFSLYAVSSSLLKIYPDKMETWGPLMTSFTAGVSVVSLMNLIKTCGEYYRTAKETYL